MNQLNLFTVAHSKIHIHTLFTPALLVIFFCKLVFVSPYRWRGCRTFGSWAGSCCWTSSTRWLTIWVAPPCAMTSRHSVSQTEGPFRWDVAKAKATSLLDGLTMTSMYWSYKVSVGIKRKETFASQELLFPRWIEDCVKRDAEKIAGQFFSFHAIFDKRFTLFAA